MGLTQRLVKVQGAVRRFIPQLVGYLWVPALLTFFISEIGWVPFESVPGFLLARGLQPWLMLMFVTSLLFMASVKKDTKFSNWLSLLTWISVLGAFSLWLSGVGWLPNAMQFIDADSLSNFDYIYILLLPLEALDLRLMLVMALAMWLLALHRTGDSDGAHPIGGRWRPVYGWALAVFLAMLLEQYNIFDHFSLLLGWTGSVEVLGSDASEWFERANYYRDFIPSVVVSLSVLIIPFFVAAWKTCATLALSPDRMTVGLGRGLPLFSVKWRNVLSVKELRTPGKPGAFIVEHGVLPWYRFRFGLSKRRDGEATVQALLNRCEGKRRVVRVRRYTDEVGWALVVFSLGCMIAMQKLINYSFGLIAAASTDLPRVFESAGYFRELAMLEFAAALFFGLGIGLLFARNYGGLRIWPIIGVGVGAGIMPGTTIVSLVYIAIYAILLSRLGPVEPVPHLVFPDPLYTLQILWVDSHTVQIAVAAYVVGTLLSVRPWYSALPSWPYRRRRADTEFVKLAETVSGN